MKKTIESIILIGALGLVGCHKSENKYSNNTTNDTHIEASSGVKQSENKVKRYTFDNFGVIGNINTSSMYRNSATSVAVGDIDGDGDLDIVVADESGKITIYENQIPQKNISEKSEKTYK